MAKREGGPKAKKEGARSREKKDAERFGQIQVSNGPRRAHEKSEYMRPSNLQRRVDSEDANYFAEKHGPDQLSWRPDSYVMSSVDSRDKTSDGFDRCLGLVAVGRDKETGNNIAFLSHQSPPCFYKHPRGDIVNYTERRKVFKESLTKRLDELKGRAEEGSIDMIVFGGVESDAQSGDYRDQAEALAKLAEEVGGIQARIVDIPNRRAVDPNPESTGFFAKLDVQTTNAYFDTPKRRLYVGKYEHEVQKYPYED